MPLEKRNTAHSATRAKKGITEATITNLLDEDYTDGNLQTSRGGKINRKHYAKIIGCAPSALTKFRHIFSIYERKANIQTGPMRHLEEMRNWLKEEFQAGRLRLRNGKLDRSAFQKHFDLRGGNVFTRHPEIRMLFEIWDARIQAEKYLPASLEQELERLTAALAEGPLLNKSRLSVNLVALAETVGITKSRLKLEPFSGVLLEHETKLLVRAKESRIDPFVHGRVFPFSGLQTRWSSRFLEQVGSRFKKFAPSLSRHSVKRPYLELVVSVVI